MGQRTHSLENQHKNYLDKNQALNGNSNSFYVVKNFHLYLKTEDVLSHQKVRDEKETVLKCAVIELNSHINQDS